MTGHTAGPWRVEGAYVVGADGVITRQAAPYSAALDDLRLIAAAPDGLALARYAVDNPDFDSAVFDRMAREFIAKATGAQS